MSSNALDLESSANPQQILDSSQLERKISKSTKPLSMKMDIVLRYSKGESKRAIARDLSITNNTVASILKEVQFDKYVSDGAKSGMNSLAFESVETVAHHVGKKNLKAAMYVLDKTVFVEESGTRQFSQNLQVNVHIPRPDPKQFEQRQIASNSEVLDVQLASTTTNSGSTAKSKR